MTIRPWFFYALFCALMLFGGHASEPVNTGESEQDVTELEEQMDRMNTAFRKLRRQAGEATKNESSLGLVATMRAVIPEALKLTPAKTVDLPKRKQQKFVEGYRKQLEKLSAKLSELETAFKANNNSDAVQLIIDLRAIQKAGHRKYKKEKRE